MGCSAIRMLWGSKAKRSQTKQWLMLELVTANSAQGRSWFWKVSTGKHFEILQQISSTCNRFLHKMSFARAKGSNKIHISGQPHQTVNKIAATGQQTSVTWILLFNWRTVISWKMQGCWGVLKHVLNLFIGKQSVFCISVVA